MILKVNKELILESVFSDTLDKIKGWLGIPVNKLDKFIKEYFKNDSKKILNESQTFKASKRIEGTVNMTDTCYTAVMKLIGKENLLKKTHYSGGKFLELYAKIAKPIPITKANVNKLKKGVVILDKYKPNDAFSIKLNDHYDENGISNKNGWVKGIAHFMIVIDPKKYLVLHSTSKLKQGRLSVGMGSNLELVIQEYKPLFKNLDGTNYALDMNVINKM